MRALAFGMLDPDGERHRVALAHVRACPSCRSRVASLRGLAVALPPVLTLPGRAGLAALAAGGAHGSAGSIGSGASAPLGVSAAAGSGAAGGGWALGGSGLAAKLAAGCLLAIGVGAGCVTLGRAGGHRGHPVPAAGRSAAAAPARIRRGRPALRSHATPRHRPAARARTASENGARREFTPEQPEPVPAGKQRVARAARERGGHQPGAAAPAGAAEREFSPG